MESQRVVSRARAEQFATDVGGLLCETSAKENWGVQELFLKVCDRVMETRGPELRGETTGTHGGAGARSGAKHKFGLSPAAHAAGFGAEGSGESGGGCCS